MGRSPARTCTICPRVSRICWTAASTSGFFSSAVAIAPSILRRWASGVRRSSSELAGGSLMLVTGSGDCCTAGAGISGSVGKVICMGSGIPCSMGPSKPRESEAGLVRLVTGETTGLGIGVGNPGGIGARASFGPRADGALVVTDGIGVPDLAASIWAEVGKDSFMMALTSGAAGVGLCAIRFPADHAARKAAKMQAPRENFIPSPTIKPRPQPAGKTFQVSSASGAGASWPSSSTAWSPSCGSPSRICIAT